jgi:protein-tyrosine-phosphatase
MKYSKQELSDRTLEAADITIDSAGLAANKMSDEDSLEILKSATAEASGILGVDENKLTAAIKIRLRERA